MENRKHKIIKSLTAFVFAAALALTGTVPSFAAEKTFEGAGEFPDTTSTSVIVMDAGSGEVLYEKDAHKKRDPASMTKILNLLVCLDTLDFDQEVTVEKNTTGEGTDINLQKGEKITIRNLAYGMMLASANDAAEYLGYLAGDGDIDAFCDMMDAKAKSLGATDTDYKNPNGLNPDKVNNVTTAYDLALMVREGMKDKRFREIVGTREYTIDATNKSKKRKLHNSNMCLYSEEIQKVADGDKEALKKYIEKYKSNPDNYVPEDEAELPDIVRNAAKARAELMYKPCIGVKTGYTSSAGDCFAGFAKKGDMEIIAVVMNAPHAKNKFQDVKKLWKYSFANFKSYTAQSSDDFKYQMKVKRGSLREVDLGIKNDLKVTALKKDNPEESVTTEVELTEEKPMAPVKKGAVVGRLVAYENGEEVSSQDLVSLETAEEGGPLSYIGIADEDVPKFFILLGLAIVVLIIVRYMVKTSRKNKARRRRRAERREAEKREAERREPNKETIRRDNERSGKH